MTTVTPMNSTEGILETGKNRLDSSARAALQLISLAKNRGAFNTPETLANFLVNWALRSPEDSAIDPSCGDGAFLQAAADRLSFLGAQQDNLNHLVGVEIDRTTAKECRKRLQERYGTSPQILTQGFFDALRGMQAESYSAVIGNPPFVRYRNFFPTERELAFEFMRQQGFHPSKLANAWVPFLVAAIHLLKVGGRLGMVMPAELFQVSYASEIREYLLNRFGFIFVVTFNELVFPGVEQEIVLLMGTKGEGSGLRLIEVKDETELNIVSQTRIPQVPVQDSREKWTQYFLNDSQRNILRKGLSIKKLGDFSSVDVGVVTGTNDFFILTQDKARMLDADEHLIPTVTRTKQIPGIIFGRADWKNNVANDQPSHLLAVKPALGVSDKLREYLIQGSERGFDKHYKCRIRDPWYVVPSIWIPDAFLYRQIGLCPKLVLNRANATCTDTLHRVKFKPSIDAKKIVACFHNSLTFAFSEIVGRSYGGGVLELMPTEAERLPVPVANSRDFIDDVDRLVREGLLADAVSLVDERVLHEELGFDRNEIALIRSAWLDLAKRRRARNPNKK